MLKKDKRIYSREVMKKTIKLELEKLGIKRWKILMPFRESDILAKHMILLRKTEYYTNINNKIIGTLFKLRLYLFQNKYSIHIPINCCEEGLKLMHVGSVLINANACIGKNCSLHINTTIAANGLNSNAPVLGNGIVVGVGAVILGEIIIADNVAIGANAVVCKSVVEESVTVAGVPAKIVNYKGRSEWNKQ